MRAIYALLIASVFVQGHGQQQVPPGSPALNGKSAQVPVQLRGIAGMLGGTWSITWIDKEGHTVGEGEEVWKIAPGGSALTEENRSIVNGRSAEDYAVIWWDNKAQRLRGLWCDAEINDEGCSGFTVKTEGGRVILSGVWDYRGKPQSWRETLNVTRTSLTQTLSIGEVGKELMLASTIRGKKH